MKATLGCTIPTSMIGIVWNMEFNWEARPAQAKQVSIDDVKSMTSRFEGIVERSGISVGGATCSDEMQQMLWPTQDMGAHDKQADCKPHPSVQAFVALADSDEPKLPTAEAAQAGDIKGILPAEDKVQPAQAEATGADDAQAEPASSPQAVPSMPLPQPTATAKNPGALLTEKMMKAKAAAKAGTAPRGKALSARKQLAPPKK